MDIAGTHVVAIGAPVGLRRVPRRRGAAVGAGQQPLQQEVHLASQGGGADPAIDLQQCMRLFLDALVDDRRTGTLDVLFAVLELAEIGAGMEQADYWEQDFYPAAISRNHHDSLLGDQLPRVHYLDAESFEALGDEATWKSLPVWGDCTYDRWWVDASGGKPAGVIASIVDAEHAGEALPLRGWSAYVAFDVGVDHCCHLQFFISEAAEVVVSWWGIDIDIEDVAADGIDQFVTV